MRGRAELPEPEADFVERGAVGKGEGDEVVGLHAGRLQSPGARVGPAVKLGETQRLLVVLDGEGVSPAPGNGGGERLAEGDLTSHRVRGAVLPLIRTLRRIARIGASPALLTLAPVTVKLPMTGV